MSVRMRFLCSAILMISIAANFSCSKNPNAPGPDQKYGYIVPPRLDDGLEAAHIKDVELDFDKIENMLSLVILGVYENIHSILIVKDSKLVVEEYFAGRTVFNEFKQFDRSTLHNMHSVTKSLASALIGIAIDHGLIASVNEKLIAFFPEYADILSEGGKENITLENVLTMASGLEWDERSYSYEDPRNDHEQMYRSGNWIRYVLSKPLVDEPGTKFIYNSGLSITLGGIVRNVSGELVDDFARENLFLPLGISDYAWHKSTDGTAQTGGGLSLRPRDMVKFGLLYLNRGLWKGQRIISERWVAESTSSQPPNTNYGYQWWLADFTIDGQAIHGYSANGRGGQFIFVFPDLNLVAVFTGGNDNNLSSQPRDMLSRSILPAALQN